MVFPFPGRWGKCSNGSGKLLLGEGWRFLWLSEGTAVGSGLTLGEGSRWAWASEAGTPPVLGREGLQRLSIHRLSPSSASAHFACFFFFFFN